MGTVWTHSPITNHVTLFEKLANLQSSLQSSAAFARWLTSGSGSLASQTSGSGSSSYAAASEQESSSDDNDNHDSVIESQRPPQPPSKKRKKGSTLVYQPEWKMKFLSLTIQRSSCDDEIICILCQKQMKAKCSTGLRHLTLKHPMAKSFTDPKKKQLLRQYEQSLVKQQEY